MQPCIEPMLGHCWLHADLQYVSQWPAEKTIYICKSIPRLGAEEGCIRLGSWSEVTKESWSVWLAEKRRFLAVRRSTQLAGDDNPKYIYTGHAGIHLSRIQYSASKSLVVTLRTCMHGSRVTWRDAHAHGPNLNRLYWWTIKYVYIYILYTYIRIYIHRLPRSATSFWCLLPRFARKTTFPRFARIILPIVCCIEHPCNVRSYRKTAAYWTWPSYPGHACLVSDYPTLFKWKWVPKSPWGL